jgi:TRAP-type C4-dicarboxylate transport system substrate-binding protein
MNQKYLDKSKARILASNWYQGTRHTLSKEPINSIEDFKGLKIRVPQLPEWVEMWKRLGANPTQISFPEVYTALQQGVVDGMECPLFYFYSSSFYEQAKYITLTAHNIYSNSVIINDKVYKKLPEEHQKILLDAAVEAGMYETKLTIDADKELYEKLEAADVTFTELNNDEIAQRIRPVYDSWTKVFGADLLEKVDGFKANYNKNN